VKKLSVALNQAVKTPELANALKAQGAEAGGMSVTEFVAYVKAESDKWRTVIKAGDIKVD
jgi:tripartite-type tricarboxylate transporter receptor subunit TctC